MAELQMNVGRSLDCVGGIGQRVKCIDSRHILEVDCRGLAFGLLWIEIKEEEE